jgi:hypothetical protein
MNGPGEGDMADREFQLAMINNLVLESDGSDSEDFKPDFM